MASTQPPGKSPRPITGRTVLVSLIAFFGVVFAVNGWMAYSALRTFGGVVTENPYKLGLAYNKEISTADAQRGLAWTVDANLSGTDAARIVTLSVRNKAGNPEAGLAARVTVVHPSSRTHDVELDLSEVSAGVYRGTYAAASGERDLVIELRRGDQRVFRSENRVSLH